MQQTYNKEYAIQLAKNLAAQHKEKHYVIYEPDTYRDLFEGKTYKVVRDLTENQIIGIVFTAPALKEL